MDPPLGVEDADVGWAVTDVDDTGQAIDDVGRRDELMPKCNSRQLPFPVISPAGDLSVLFYSTGAIIGCKDALHADQGVRVGILNPDRAGGR